MDCRAHLTAIVLLLAVVAANAQTSLRDSLQMLNRQIAAQPANTDARLRKAALNISLGQWDYAIDEYGRVLDIDSANMAAYFYRAYAHNRLRHYDSARQDYEAMLRLMPRHYEAQLGLAVTLEKMERNADALEELNKLVQAYPDSALAYAVRAELEEKSRMWDAAVFDWDEAIRRRPLADYYVAKARLLLKMNDRRQAKQVISDALKQGLPQAALRDWDK